LTGSKTGVRVGETGTKGDVMSWFRNEGSVNYDGVYGFSWVILNKETDSDPVVYFGLDGTSPYGVAQLSNRMTPEDAEAIGYSLLAAAKAARGEA
jgi:hypothetical protein